MNNFLTLLNKEFLGLWRSSKVIWLPIVFMLLSLMQPVTYYFMDDIMKMSGSLPEGAVFEMPIPTSGEVMASVLSQLNTIGLLLIIVAAMGTISDERKSGALMLIFTRPLSSLQIVASKTVAHATLLVFSFVCGYLLSLYYTILLFSSLPFTDVLVSMLIYSLYIVFVVSCVVLTSAILSGNGAIAIINVIFISLLTLASGYFQEQLAWSPTQLSSYASSIVMGKEVNEGLVGSIILTICLIIILQIVASNRLNKNKLG